MRAVFGGRPAGQLLSERAGCGLGVWLWLSARAVHFWWGRLAVGWPVGLLVVKRDSTFLLFYGRVPSTEECHHEEQKKKGMNENLKSAIMKNKRRRG